MTTPTQPPDPRVERIAKALAANKLSLITSVALARVLVEELGGRERETVKRYDEPRTIWRQVMDALEVESNADAVQKALTLRAQQRENAETIKVLKERVETAEAANTALDNARKSAEQSARDLRENNATLRAELDAINTKTEHDQALMDTQAKLIVDLETELDAIKGAQRGVKFIAHNDVECTARFADGKYNITWQHGELGPMTLDAMYKTWSHLKAEERAALEALRHHAPALPVVGACVIGVLTAKTDKETNSTSFHMDTSKYIPSKIVPPDGEYDIWLGAPLPTEGGK